ncbi:MAG TPA: hypothetical protein VJ792_07650 [Candidatus Nitrosotalea sp.]|nr:hypothetical protein [Candidatus Nitrosotalea sp.]
MGEANDAKGIPRSIVSSTPLLVLVAFAIASSSFGLSYVLVNSHVHGWEISLNHESEYSIQKKFFSNLDPGEKKGFILGTSQIQALNSSYIQQYLHVHGKNFKIYNLSVPSDKPVKRLSTLDMLISSRPDFVVYEISDIDFLNLKQSDSLLNETAIAPLLPDPQFAIHSLALKTQVGLHIDMPISPKFRFFSLIGDDIASPDPLPIPVVANTTRDPNLPFSNVSPGHQQQIFSDTHLSDLKGKEYYYNVNDITPAPINENALAVIDIVKRLQENHIKVIIFIAPSHRYHIEDMGEKRVSQFNSVVGYISSQTGIHIYDLYDKYEDLPIFYDLIHVAMNKDAIIYSQDISKIILGELQ